MSNNDLIAKVTELKELKLMADELQAEITAIEDDLKRELENQKTDEITAGMFKVRYKSIATNKFDSKAFKAKYEDLYNQFCRQSESKRFSIA
ncbi:hypothetical protein LJB89_01635 [Tyzzerella sp. OttesenSCG-928-J15]|nr:hypothetical protein [Tyzzerella sp. OttesenSCG-928-J15]